MKRIYHHYLKWEDWENGLYRTEKENETIYIDDSFELLSNPSEFLKIGLEMIENWTVSAEVNLSHKGINRQAWIGQASCCFNHGASETQTIVAWRMLNEEQQEEANLIADKIIKIWENKYA